jgi:putrescine transport system substrate-binding protein
MYELQLIRVSTLTAFILAVIMPVNPVWAEGTLNVYNWAEYIAEDTISKFEKEFDIDVTYDHYPSVEKAQAKLLAGGSGYDVVNHAGSEIGLLISAGDILQPLDKSRLPNLQHLHRDVMHQLASNWDNDNRYVIPYMWGTHGVTYNETLVRSVLPDAPIGSMDLIFKSKNMKKLAACGVAFLDSPTDIMPMALAYLGLNPSSKRISDYSKAAEMLLKVRPYIKTFDNYAYQKMPEKEFCIAVTWGPDGLFAMSNAKDANTGVVLNFFSPPGLGAANLWIDGWVIPADAKNVANAHLFLNYMMRPEVAANDSNHTSYATANQSALPMVDQTITSNAAAYPPAEAISQMYTLAVVPQKVRKARTRAWVRFKSGQ